MYLIVFSISLLPLIVSLNGQRVECDFKTFGSIGCSQQSRMVCDNSTNYCQCNQTDEFRISFGDNQCLPVRHIDQKCLISDQCVKTAKNQLFCYYMDSSAKRLIKLNSSLAIDLSQRLNKSIEGFCRCDDNHYYDYEENRCEHQNRSFDFGLNLAPIMEEYFCSQCPSIDPNSYCDHKDMSCLCRDGFVKNSFGKCVRMRQLYESCGQTDECIVSNAYCEPIVDECICSSGYLPDVHKRHCLKARHIYDKCAEQRDCSGYLFGYCDSIRFQCLCNSSSVLLNTYSPVCVERTKYGSECHHQFPDLVCQLTVRHSICSKYTGRCICENGFIFMSNECRKLELNRFGFGDEFHETDSNKNPMTYIVIVFCTVFGFTVFASILIKIFRRPFTRTQLALYDINNRLNQINGNNGDELRAPPAAPPVYTESAMRASSQTIGTIGSHNTISENEDKPPSYEEAVSGQYVAIN